MEIKITLEQLKSLLIEQKIITIERCLGNSSYYNKESTEGYSKSLPIDQEKFKQNGMGASFPNDFEVLKKYFLK